MQHEQPIQVALSIDGGDFQTYKLRDKTPIGRQVIDLTGARPIDEFLLFQEQGAGRLEEIQLAEAINLDAGARGRFLIFRSSASYRFEVDGERFEWGATLITGWKVKELSGRTDHPCSLWLSLIHI